jgi:hypothetical protein
MKSLFIVLLLSVTGWSQTVTVWLVGSRTGAALRRFSLAVAPRFLWECFSSQTVSQFPAPASSNPSCRFPAMGLHVCFTARVMRPLPLAGLSEMTMVADAGNLHADLASRTATSYSTVASRNPSAPGTHQMQPNLLFHPVADIRKASTRVAEGKIVHPAA